MTYPQPVSIVVANAGISTDLMESGQSEVNSFLARNAGKGETVPLD